MKYAEKFECKTICCGFFQCILCVKLWGEKNKTVTKSVNPHPTHTHFLYRLRCGLFRVMFFRAGFPQSRILRRRGFGITGCVVVGLLARDLSGETHGG